MSEKQGDILDLAIIGTGISGINSAYRAQAAFPGLNYEVFEGRKEIGGTWSFFKYPGLRSDSDLFSFGFEWNPWKSNEVIAEAADILEYLESSMKSFGMDKRTRFEHKLTLMDWSTSDKCWNLHFTVAGEKEKVVRARWIVLGTGYYDYEKALPAEIPGLQNFKGKIVHPQFWPESLDLTDKRVAIIGSGATAITILPVIAKSAKKVTIVQRSPSYVACLPKSDRSADILKRWLPLSWATRILRVKYLLLSYLFFTFCQKFPNKARQTLYAETKKQLPSNVPHSPHFTPKYAPWDQRLCMCPDGDFYEALRSGKGNIVTGHIETITDKGIKIKDQPESTLEADVIVTATGLKILTGGGAKAAVDGKAVPIPEKLLWKGCMLQDLPNCLSVVGYTNASWTLGADVAMKTLTRLMAHQRKHGYLTATPTISKERDIQAVPFMKMDSTYLLKGRGEMPKAGDKYPWLARGSYFSDMRDATWGDITQDITFT